MEIYKYSLNDIENILDLNKQERELKLFLAEVASLGLDIDQIDGNKSLESIVNEILEKEALKEYYDEIIGDNSSFYSFYPYIKQHKSRKRRVCDLCSEVIDIGITYLYYKPLIYDKVNDKAFTLTKGIVSKESCNHYLPQNYSELELLFENIENSYHIVDENNFFPNNHNANGNQVLFEEANYNIPTTYKVLRKKR